MLQTGKVLLSSWMRRGVTHGEDAQYLLSQLFDFSCTQSLPTSCLQSLKFEPFTQKHKIIEYKIHIVAQRKKCSYTSPVTHQERRLNFKSYCSYWKKLKPALQHFFSLHTTARSIFFFFFFVSFEHNSNIFARWARMTKRSSISKPANPCFQRNPQGATSTAVSSRSAFLF